MRAYDKQTVLNANNIQESDKVSQWKQIIECFNGTTDVTRRLPPSVKMITTAPKLKIVHAYQHRRSNLVRTRCQLNGTFRTNLAISAALHLYLRMTIYYAITSTTCVSFSLPQPLGVFQGQTAHLSNNHLEVFETLTRTYERSLQVVIGTVQSVFMDMYGV